MRHMVVVAMDGDRQERMKRITTPALGTADPMFPLAQGQDTAIPHVRFLPVELWSMICLKFSSQTL
ncbi:hypothetical protein [Novosphingobium sp. 1748]|uniref:hypothetical protein n=1 Tax=Novosphingobium sp. 1748 TaxID=2817760 RepID=UPI00286B8031|nr:hypothetical protein [Novosphingobium sp. 1748]